MSSAQPFRAYLLMSSPNSRGYFVWSRMMTLWICFRMQGVQGGKQAPRRTSGAMAGKTKKHFTQEFTNYAVSFVLCQSPILQKLHFKTTKDSF
jgi:hypothetical protein